MAIKSLSKIMTLMYIFLYLMYGYFLEVATSVLKIMKFFSKRILNEKQIIKIIRILPNLAVLIYF